MMVNYTLFEKDFLENQLYYASKSPFVKQAKAKSINVLVFAVVVFAICFLVSGKMLALIVYIVFCVLFLLFYPAILSAGYKKSYQKAIKEIYSQRFGQAFTLEFKDTSINDNFAMRQCEIFHPSLESIEEVSSHFFIYLKYGEQIIIPKTEVDRDATKNYLQALAQQLTIPYNSNLNWKWK